MNGKARCESQIDSGLIRAYLETDYRAGDLVLRVGQANDGLRAEHARRGVGTSAFVTAWNPGSRVLADEENRRRNDELRAVILRAGWHAVDGVGRHPDNGWSGEESLLVFGPALQEATALGQQFGQNAIVWSGEDAVPRLVLLR